MGLDMSIFKIKRFNNATLDDVVTVESYLDLVKYNAENPDKQYTMINWCGRDKPSDKLIEFYSRYQYEKYGSVRIAEEVAYWRKANAIHRWFVDNVQDGVDDCCVHRELTRSDLETLRDIAHKVLINPEFADELLPTQSGFFFGDTQYDEWYFEDIQNTITQINKILESTDFNTEALYYVSSWQERRTIMKIKREINGETVEIELTRNEMSLAYEEIRRETWEFCIREQIDNDAGNLRFTDDFDKDDFIGECMEEMENQYYTDDYDEKAESIVFNVAEMNDIWVDDPDEDGDDDDL